MGCESLVATEIQKGNLIAPFLLSIPEPYSYNLIYPKEVKQKHQILRDWLMNQVKKSALKNNDGKLQ